MKLTIKKDELLKGLHFAQSVANMKSSNPMLANVLLRTSGQNFICNATDLQTSIESVSEAEIETAGEVALPAKKFYEVVKNLPNGDIFLEKQDNEWLKIRCGNAKYKMAGTIGRDMPKMPSVEGLKSSLIDSRIIAEIIGKTVFSSADPGSRHYLNSVFFESNGGTMKAVATDGHRMVKIEREVENAPVFEPGIIIPKKSAIEMRKLGDAVKGECLIGVTDSHVFMDAAGVKLFVKLIDASYPPYAQLIPSETGKNIKLDRGSFIDVLKRVLIMDDGIGGGVRFELTSGNLRIIEENPDRGDAREDIEIGYDGEDMTIGFNARYILDMLNVFDEDEINFCLNGELDAGLIKNDSSSYLGIVMPMRV